MNHELCPGLSDDFIKALDQDYKDGRTVVDLCFMLRSSTNGAADPWQNDHIKEVIHYLKWRLDQWYESNDPIDNAVRLIIGCAINIGESEIDRLQKDGWNY